MGESHYTTEESSCPLVTLESECSGLVWMWMWMYAGVFESEEGTAEEGAKASWKI